MASSIDRPRKRGGGSGLVGPILAATAVAGAVTAIWTELQARRAERRNRPVGRFVYVDGTTLHYVDRGRGPAVVLIHGNGVRLQDFIASGLVDRLAEHHRVIAFDRPGFGYSTRPRNRPWTVAAQAAVFGSAFRLLGIERPVVLGHSFGTMVALEIALQRPAGVAGLVLLGGYYFPTMRLDVALNAPAAVPILGDVMRYTVMPVLGRLGLRLGLERLFAPLPVPDGYLPALSREMILRPVQLRASAEDASAMLPGAAALEGRYRTLTMPVAIIAGDADRIVDPVAHSQRLHDEVPGSELVRVPHTGHMVHHAVPEQVVAAIERVSAAAGSARAT